MTTPGLARPWCNGNSGGNHFSKHFGKIFATSSQTEALSHMSTKRQVGNVCKGLEAPANEESRESYPGAAHPRVWAWSMYRRRRQGGQWSGTTSRNGAEHAAQWLPLEREGRLGLQLNLLSVLRFRERHLSWSSWWQHRHPG
jgi:hypothetical protein